MSYFNKHFLLIALALLVSINAQSQQWQLDRENGAKITVSGTSSLTDWTVDCSDLQIDAQKMTLDPANPEKIDEFGFKVPIEGMDGGRGSSMNDKILEAFKSSEHPFITYQQQSPATVEKDENGKLAITSNGTLTMAGTSKSIQITSTASVENGKLIITGHKNLNMSDYEMTPPSAMFGQIKTNDEVVVSYEFQYVKQ